MLQPCSLLYTVVDTVFYNIGAYVVTEGLFLSPNDFQLSFGGYTVLKYCMCRHESNMKAIQSDSTSAIHLDRELTFISHSNPRLDLKTATMQHLRELEVLELTGKTWKLTKAHKRHPTKLYRIRCCNCASILNFVADRSSPRIKCLYTHTSKLTLLLNEML